MSTTYPHGHPGIQDADKARRIREMLQDRLICLLDLQLTLKHIHWNVVGPNFIAVHQMLDPQVDAVRSMSDTTAERIATLGGEPLGTPDAIVGQRRWADYKLNGATTTRHLEELSRVYDGVIADHRRAIEQLEELDLVSQDIVISQTEKLEMFQWFVQAHLQSD
jgi:starvation-inducible DNA-binding protein